MKMMFNRVNALIDPGSLLMLGAMSASPVISEADQDGVLTGFARIGGVPVALMAEDRETLRNTDAQIAQNKQQRMMAIARQRGLPLLYLSDHPGTNFIASKASALLTGTSDQRPLASLTSGLFPLLLVFYGAHAGLGAHLLPVATTVMTVMNSGVASTATEGSDILAKDETEAGTVLRKVIPLLAGQWQEGNGRAQPGMGQRDGAGEDMAPVRLILDDDSGVAFPLAGDQVTGILGRVRGRPVAILDCGRGRPVLTTALLNRMHRFIECGTAAKLPLIFVQDCAGYDSDDCRTLPFSQALAHLSGTISAYVGPKLVVITGRGHALGDYVLGGRRLGMDYIAAWPMAEVGIISHEVFAADQLPSTYPDSPWTAAGRGIIDDVILPQETGERLHVYLSLLEHAMSYPDPLSGIAHRPLASIR